MTDYGFQAMRWILLASGIAACLYFLNDAAFSAWMAGGPPSSHKLGWELRSQANLFQSVGALLLGITTFKVVGDAPRIARISYVIGALAILALLVPHAQKALHVDKCLDSGGKWSDQTLECVHQ